MLIGIVLVIGGIVIFKNVTMSTAMLAIMFTLIVGICWIMEGAVSYTHLVTAVQRSVTALL